MATNRLTGQPLLEPAVADSVSQVSAFQHLVMRGREPFSVLVGVRALTGTQLTLNNWRRMEHERYGDKLAYSRSLISTIHTHDHIGLMGHEHTVHVIHVNRHLKRWPGKLQDFWEWLALRCRGCDVMMGDFSLQLFKVVPELRQRGVQIDLAAWFPWKRNDGEPCADSCAIFFLNRPGQYKLTKGLKDLHSKDAGGLLFRDAAVAAGGENAFAVFTENGPGVPLENYHGDLRTTLTPTLDESAIESMKRASVN